jgi:glycosyltransferase involved in cell wall biosynthesis
MNNPRNILVFAQYFPPEIGAATRRSYWHARKWAEMGHQVTVITNVPHSPFGTFYPGYKNKFIQTEEMDGIKVVRLLTWRSGKKSNTFARFISSFVYFFMTLGTIFMKKPDIVLGSAPFFAGFSGHIAAKLKRVPLIYEMRDPWLQLLKERQPKFNFLVRLLERWERRILRKADRVVVIGEQMGHYIRETYRLQESPETIYNGIEKEVYENFDPASAGPLPQNIHIDAKRFNIGFVGNLGNQYDLDIVLKVATLMKDEQVDFIFIGEGKWKNSLQRQIIEIALDNVHVYDAVSTKESMIAVARMDLTIIPLRVSEACDIYLPLKLFESLALSVPPLLCNGKEAASIIEKAGSGAIFDSNQPEQLVTIIKSYAQNPEKLQSQGHAGKAFILEHYNRGIMARKYNALFESLLRYDNGREKVKKIST